MWCTGSKQHSIRLQPTQASNDTSFGYKRHSLQAVELSWRLQTAVQIVSKPPASTGARFTWLALLLIKAGDVETNPGPTTTHKQVWIYDICHKQIHDSNQISIKCNSIEHWVHLRCAGIRLVQYTDTWTYTGLTTHTDITPPLQTLIQAPYTLPTYTTATQAHTHVQHSPCSHRIGKAQTQSAHLLGPLSSYAAPNQTYTFHIIHQFLSSHAPHSSLSRQML